MHYGVWKQHSENQKGYSKTRSQAPNNVMMMIANPDANSSNSISSFIVFRNPLIHRYTRKQAIFYV